MFNILIADGIGHRLMVWRVFDSKLFVYYGTVELFLQVYGLKSRIVDKNVKNQYNMLY